MKNLVIPKHYHSDLGLLETEIAIKDIKDFFERSLAEALNLTRVSAPLFVRPESGLNDNLNGVERPVSFGIREQDDSVCEIVHSLAKWKRNALAVYGFQHGTGLYTDMNAIRRDEDTDNLHSLYVDQWDWERVITKDERNLDFLFGIVQKIYGCLLATEDRMIAKYPKFERKLPKTIKFLTTQELEDRYPDKMPKERELEACREYGAVFLAQIGCRLRSGEIHDGRAPDYDDWSLNGDILLYYPLLDVPFEISSMGVRVDPESLKAQLAERDSMERLKLPFQKALSEGKLPLTIGGGIGQSRLCMYFLNKAHIGEVQVSVWPAEDIAALEKAGINLL